MAVDVYKMVTDRIVEELEKGTVPWQRGWSGAADGAYNYVSKRPYSLINQLMLKHQDAYLTFKQVTEKGGKVNKGAKAEIVVFWKILRKEDPVEKDKDGKPVVHSIPMLKYYNVFWIGDTNLERKEVERVEHEPVKEAENVIEGYLAREASLKFQNDQPSNQAYYAPLKDAVVVPMLSQFKNVEEYYSTAFHELTHSTGSKARLNRIDMKNLAAFGSENYSKEELVAELGAAMLVNTCGLETTKSFKNSASYIHSWLVALKNDKRLIVSAAGKAEKAVNYILKGEKA